MFRGCHMNPRRYSALSLDPACGLFRHVHARPVAGISANFAHVQVMPLVEKVLDKSNSFVTAETKTALGSGARDLLAKIEGTVQGIDPQVSAWA